MRTGNIAVFRGAGIPFAIEQATVPPLSEGEILVRNEYVTLCRSDLNTFSGKRTEKTPTILGHEIVGVIEELATGAPVQDFCGAELRVGDRITWAVYASDPASRLSRMGIPQKAPDLFKYGHEEITPTSNWHGGLADFCILRRHTPVIRIEKTMPLPVAALINCAVATVAGSMRLAGTIADQNVIIAGAGMLGVIACAMCRSAGAEKIVCVDIDDQRLETAKKFGADFTVNLKSETASLKEVVKRAGDEPVSVALDYSGVPETMESLIEVLGTGGTAVFVGATYPQRPLHISAEQLIRRVHTLKGLHNYNAHDLATAVEFMKKNHAHYPFESLVIDQFDLNTVNEAFDFGMKSGAYRVGVRIAGW